MVYVCINIHGLIAAHRQYISIRATNIKNGKKLPWNRVKDDTNSWGPVARAKKVHYNRCLCLRILCGHYGSFWIDFLGVNKLSLVWAKCFTHQSCLRVATTPRNTNSKVECQVFIIFFKLIVSMHVDCLNLSC